MCFSRKYLTVYQFYTFLVILQMLCQVNHCATPQASQEDVLHSFKSYSDVAMFHYTVPKEVIRATWQFAAFMDDPSCQPREVYIHLRLGSYPIIPTNNESFFINAHTENNHDIIVTAMTTYRPIYPTIVPIYGPEAGDWFVAAYMSPWDQRVQQQGLGHKCQYSIGTVALWSQVDSIENIPIGCEIMSQTNAMITHYKIYIPSGIWDFRVSIWNCNFTVQDISGLCIESMSLKGRSLSISNNSLLEKSISLTTNASHTFVESSPYEDSYYYLSIVSNSIIKFNIKVDVTECPIKVTEKFFNNKFFNTGASFNSITESNAKDYISYMQYYKENSTIDKHESHKNKFYKRNEEYIYNTDMCIPRHQLARIKHTEAFSTVYLLQGKEWLSSRLMLTDLVPVLTQFNILPFIDTGGTLDINAQLEIEKLTSKRLVMITICVQRGHIPKLGEHRLCENSVLSMNLSSFDKHNASLLIAYPQADTWYIIIDTICYNDNSPVYCEFEDISLLLNVRTKKCVFSDPSPCGNHGVCREIQKGNLYYTTCNCFEGYAGYGCTDVISTTAAIYSAVSSTMLILSNAFFIPAIYLAVKRELYAEGLVYFATMLFSSFYHACDQNEAFCVTKYEALQYSDFFSSILAFWVTLIAMAKLTNKFVSICHMTGVFIITIVVQVNKMYLLNILAPLLMGVLIFIVMHTYRNIYTGQKWKKPRGKTIIGLLLAIMGMLLYTFVETEGNYGYVHSMWHIVIATSLIFLLPSKRFILSMNITPNNNNSELQNPKEHHDTPAFTIIDLEK